MKPIYVSFKNYWIGLVAGSVVAFSGCATETAKKPAAIAGPSGAVAAPPTGRAPAEKPLVSSNPASPGSSLDALRQGRAAADGPMKTIYFDFDSYALTADSRAVLKSNAAWLIANPGSCGRDRRPLRRARHDRIQPRPGRQAGTRCDGLFNNPGCKHVAHEDH